MATEGPVYSHLAPSNTIFLAVLVFMKKPMHRDAIGMEALIP